MVDEVVAYLVSNKDGIYCDLTVGSGGHLKAISKVLNKAACLYGLDKDPSAVIKAKDNLKDCSQLKDIICASYSEIDTVVDRLNIKDFDGILLDLGISSQQIDDPKRGFSFRFDSPLDMRFNPDSETKTAADLINNSSERQLSEIIYKFGEERNANRIARAIVRERQKKMILTTAHLTEIIKKVVKSSFQVKTLARVFQALRIAVNSELEQLEEVLPEGVALLKTGGRIAILSYHSLEDRLVKRFFQQEAKGCICPPEFSVCVCNHKPSLKIITKKAISPRPWEIEQNNRARSAKLRVAEKI